MEDWETQFIGFHPMVDVSLCALLNKMPNTTISVVDGEADIAKARSTNLGIWKKMWDEGNKHDYFLVLDDDMEFRPGSVERLIENDKDVGHGIYTFRSKIPGKSGQPTCTFFDNEVGSLIEPFKIRWAAGGFILLKAHVLHAMIEKYKDLEYDLPIPAQPSDSVVADSTRSRRERIVVNRSWDLWDQYIYQINGNKVRLTEDYAFSQKIRDTGFDIWADWRVKLVHWDGVDGYTFTPQ